MISRQQYGLILLVVACLIVGVFIYATGRPVDSAFILPNVLRIRIDHPILEGVIGQTLPSFLHAFAFSVLTAWCLMPLRIAAIFACTFWFVISGAFEIAQSDSVTPLVHNKLPAAFANWPIFDHVGTYLSNGTFDPLDLSLTGIGCGLAFLLLTRGVVR